MAKTQSKSSTSPEPNPNPDSPVGACVVRPVESRAPLLARKTQSLPSDNLDQGRQPKADSQKAILPGATSWNAKAAQFGKADSRTAKAPSPPPAEFSPTPP